MPHFNAWLAVGLLWPVALLNYLDRQMLSTVRKGVLADPALAIPPDAADAQFGLLMAAFLYVYGLLSPVGGFVGDRLPRRWTIVVSLFAWSGVTWATGQARSFDELLLLRALMGVSEAFYIPAALALIADFHPGPTRTRAVGLHQTGIYAGLFLGGVGGYFVEAGSWRDGFTAFGAVGVVYAAVLAVALREPPRPAPTATDGGGSLAALAREPAYWLLVLYFTLPAVPGWAVRNWLPTHLADAYALKPLEAGMLATGTFTLGSLVGAVVGGTLSDDWGRRTPRGRFYASACGTGLCALTLAQLAWVDSAWGAAGLVVLFGVGWGLFDANNMPILCQIAGPGARATGYGMMNLVSTLAGAAATQGLGKMKDAGVSLGVGFTLSAGVALLAVGLILLAKPRRS